MKTTHGPKACKVICDLNSEATELCICVHMQVEALAVSKFGGAEQFKAEQSKRSAKKAARLEKKVQALTTQAASASTLTNGTQTSPGAQGGELTTLPSCMPSAQLFLSHRE